MSDSVVTPICRTVLLHMPAATKWTGLIMFAFWAFVGGRCIWLRAISESPPQEEVSVDPASLTPSGDEVLTKLGSAIAGAFGSLSERSENQVEIINQELRLVKSRLRRINIGMVDDPVERDALLELRRNMLITLARGQKGLASVEIGALNNIRDVFLRDLLPIRQEMQSFAEGHGILPEEISSKDAREFIFSESLGIKLN